MSIDYRQYGPLYSVWARLFSFAMSLGLTAAILFMPQEVALADHELKTGLLFLVMFGICSGFVHGLGYVPETRIFRWLFSPYIAWPVIIGFALWWY